MGCAGFAGRYVDAYLPRSGSVLGYTVAVWKYADLTCRQKRALGVTGAR